MGAICVKVGIHGLGFGAPIKRGRTKVVGCSIDRRIDREVDVVVTRARASGLAGKKGRVLDAGDRAAVCMTKYNIPVHVDRKQRIHGAAADERGDVGLPVVAAAAAALAAAARGLAGDVEGVRHEWQLVKRSRVCDT